MKFLNLKHLSLAALVLLSAVPSCKSRNGSDLLSDKNGNGTLISCEGRGVQGINTAPGGEKLFTTDLWVAHSHPAIGRIVPITKKVGNAEVVDTSLNAAQIAAAMLERIKFIDYEGYQEMKKILIQATPSEGSLTARVSDDFDVSAENPTLGAFDLPANQDIKCKPTYVAINGPSNLRSYLFNYVKEKWNRLDEMNRAALMLHEVIDYHYRENGRYGSLVAEDLVFFTAHILGDKVPKINDPNILKFMELVKRDHTVLAFQPKSVLYGENSAEYPINTTDGLVLVMVKGMMHGGVEPESYQNGTLTYGYFTKSQENIGFLTTSGKVEMFSVGIDTSESQMVFDKNGKIVSISVLAYEHNLPEYVVSNSKTYRGYPIVNVIWKDLYKQYILKFNK